MFHPLKSPFKEHMTRTTIRQLQRQAGRLPLAVSSLPLPLPLPQPLAPRPPPRAAAPSLADRSRPGGVSERVPEASMSNAAAAACTLDEGCICLPTRYQPLNRSFRHIPLPAPRKSAIFSVAPSGERPLQASN